MVDTLGKRLSKVCREDCGPAKQNNDPTPDLLTHHTEGGERKW